MRLALLFSGQGQQTPEHFAQLRAEVGEALGAPVAAALGSAWTADAPAVQALQANRLAQPFIFALQMTLWLGLAGRLGRPVCAAGYSLGEMAACCAAGLFTPAEGVALCVRRAEAMDACVAHAAGLLAVLGLTQDKVAPLAARCGLHVAIRNAGDQFVLGGLATGLDAAARLAEAAGATRVVRLGVTTPSHTPLLDAASAAMADHLVPFHGARMAFPVLSAIDGRPARSAPAAAEALARQIATPLDWDACLSGVLEMKPDVVLELGPGTALARMWAERDTGIPVRASDDFRSLDGMVAWVARVGAA